MKKFGGSVGGSVFCLNSHTKGANIKKSNNQINNLIIKNAKPKQKPYKIFDKDGLFILVRPTGKKIFKIKFRYNDKENTYTIGEYPIISLSEARRELYRVKKLLADGIDPNAQKKIEKKSRITFKAIVDEFLQMKEKEVSSKRLQGNYISPLKNYILPSIGDTPIKDIEKQDIIELIEKIPKIRLEKDTKNSNKTYKSREVFNLLKSIFTFAVHKDYIHFSIMEQIDINSIVPKHKQINISAIVDEKIKDVYQAIRKRQNLTFLALEFLALTALRPSNIRFLKWEYIDNQKEVIIFPAEAMKVKTSDYRLPLTPRLREILAIMAEIKSSNYVFFSPNNPANPISDNAMRKALKETLGYKEHSLHGFRSSFKTIATERYNEHKCSFEAIETQLAHSIGTSVIRSYLRSDFLEERRKLLLWWYNFLIS